MSAAPPQLPANPIEAFRSYIASTRSGATAKRYRIAVLAFLDWYRVNEKTPLAQAPTDALERYAVSLLERKYQSVTVRSHIVGVQRYFRWLRDKYKVNLPPFSEPEYPSQKRRVKDTLDPNLLSQFFRDAQYLEEPTRTAALLLPCSGLRCEEMVSLPLSCFKRQKLTLKNGRVKDVIILRVFGKGGHERDVPLLDEGAKALVEYLTGWRRDQRNVHWLFPGRNGHLSTRTLRRAVQSIRHGASYTPHSMRRTYLTALYKQGVRTEVLTKIAGHSDVQVLVNHYLQLDSTDLAGAVHDQGGSLMKGPPK